MSASARRLVLRRLLDTHTVTSQSELVRLLEEAGHPVTQATVSRDLVAVGAAKQRVSGTTRYTIAQSVPPEHGALATTFSRFVTGVAASGNLVVLTTPPAAAHLVASAIDRSRVQGVLGTVAGDDTVFVATDEDIGGREIVSRLISIGESA